MGDHENPVAAYPPEGQVPERHPLSHSSEDSMYDHMLPLLFSLDDSVPNDGNGDQLVVGTNMYSSNDDFGSVTNSDDDFENETTETSTPSHEAPLIELVISVEQLLVGLPQSSQDFSIFRVPAKLRQLNDKAYTPQLVSIGPIHWGKPELIGMEEYKMRYLKAFLGRTAMTTESCLRLICNLENKVRSCYAESIGLSSDEFAKMVLVDSSFIIESVLRYSSDKKEGGVFHFVRSDLIVVENQLPFFVLDEIFDLAFPRQQSLLVQLLVDYFKTVFLINDPDTNGISSTTVKHLADLVRMLHLPPSRRSGSTSGSEPYIRIQTATAFQEAGMKFKRGGSNKAFLEMDFRNGELEIPPFRLHNGAEHLLRNLIALEVYFYQHDSYILDCAIFMDDLISSGKDVDILVENKIIENYIGESEAVADMFNKLTSQSLFNNYCFRDTSQGMNSFYDTLHHKWKATLKREYCSSPFKVASVVAAIILLVLTLIQTVCTFVGLSHKDTKLAWEVIGYAIAAIGIVVVVSAYCRLSIKFVTNFISLND